MLLHETTSFDVFRRFRPSRSSRRTGPAVGNLLGPSPGAAQALACRRCMAGVGGMRCGHLGPGRATRHRAISGATGWGMRLPWWPRYPCCGHRQWIGCPWVSSHCRGSGRCRWRRGWASVFERCATKKKRCRGSAFCRGRRRGRKATCPDPQNAGMIAPLYLSWMNFFTSGVCSAFTSFWMLASFARSLRAAMKLA